LESEPAVAADALTTRIVATESVSTARVDVATGRVLWRVPQTAFVEDAPSVCPEPLGSRAFCVVAASSISGASALIALAPRTGTALAAVGNVARAMGLSAGLYEVNAVAATLSQVRTPGGAVWSRTFAELFGRGYDPNNGWIFDQVGSLQVGSIGHASSGKSQDLAATETAGIDLRTGKLRWRERGEFECGGVTTFRVPFLCLMKGTETFKGGTQITTSANATLTLAGFASTTGKVTWRHPVGHIADIIGGKVVIADDHRLLVTSSAGRPQILDLRNGSTSTPHAGEAFWCQTVNVFYIAAGTAGLRIGSNVFRRCNANARDVGSVQLSGSDAAASVGVRLGSLFVWAAPDGLHAAPTT
jgi:glucose dehydrogenase